MEAGLASRCLEELVAEEAWSPSRSPPTCRQTSRRGRAGRSGWCRSRAEVALAGGLLRLLAAPSDRLPWSQTVDWTVALDWLPLHERHAGPEQAAAVQLALTERVAVLTGGPGCGKSYSVRAIVALARAKRAKVVLAAPTGQAAKRLSELAGLEAATLHRCCSCAQVATPPLTATIPWTPIWWWWMRPRCWMCCWPTSSSRPSTGAPAAGRRRGPAAPASGPARSP